MRRAELRRRLDALRDLAAADGTETTSASVDDALAAVEAAVAARRRGDEASREVIDRLAGALDGLPLGLVLADQHGEVVFRNRLATGFAEARHGEALVGSAIDELLVAAAAGTAGERTVELHGPPRRAFHLHAEPWSVPDAAGALLLVEDVSERQRLDAVRRDFVANISHELKTPVGALGVLADALAGETDPEVVHRLATRMQRDAFRVARTIDDLLQLSRIEGDDDSPRELLGVASVLAEAAARARSAADLHQIRLRVDAPAGLRLEADRRQLLSALVNLCDNAVKYSDDGAEVVLSARGVEGAVELSVADAGVGIPAADLERVFERFYRVDRARSRDTGGTGLGLAIVRHVAQNHHGTVTVRSREGEGTTFTMRLPLVAPPTGTGLAAAGPSTIPPARRTEAAP